jgi:thioredoxin reductase (NADPH)
MATADIEKVVIVGSGIAGLTAAIYASRADLSPIVIEGDEAGGQLTLTTEVENYPGFPDGIGGYDLVDAMRRQAERFGTRFVAGRVTGSRLTERPMTLTLDDGRTLATHAVIVASGARARLLGLPEEQEYFGRGLSTCATCDGAFFRDQVVAVVGGGDSAMEEATFLTRYARHVYVIHRRDTLRASKIMQDRARSKPNLEFIWNTVVKGIEGKDGMISGLRLADVHTGEERHLAVNGLFLAIGHVPNTDWLEGQLATDDQGYLLTKPGSTETDLPGVFVAGDVGDRVYQQAVTAAGTGCMAALDAEEYLAEHGLG